MDVHTTKQEKGGSTSGFQVLLGSNGKQHTTNLFWAKFRQAQVQHGTTFFINSNKSLAPV
jgi:hypothetical protein